MLYPVKARVATHFCRGVEGVPRGWRERGLHCALGATPFRLQGYVERALGDNQGEWLRREIAGGVGYLNREWIRPYRGRRASCRTQVDVGAGATTAGLRAERKAGWQRSGCNGPIVTPAASTGGRDRGGTVWRAAPGTREAGRGDLERRCSSRHYRDNGPSSRITRSINPDVG